MIDRYTAKSGDPAKHYVALRPAKRAAAMALQNAAEVFSFCSSVFGLASEGRRKKGTRSQRPCSNHTRFNVDRRQEQSFSGRMSLRKTFAHAVFTMFSSDLKIKHERRGTALTLISSSKLADSLHTVPVESSSTPGAQT